MLENVLPEYPKIDEPVIRGHEGVDWGTDPGSGAVVRRLTSFGPWSHNIYGEQPYGSPDGRRVLIARTRDYYSGSFQLLVADLDTLGMALVEPDAPTEYAAHRSWGEWVYSVMRDGSLRRLSLATLERQRVLPPGTLPVPPGVSLASISDDEKWLIAWDQSRESGSGCVTFAFNIETRERRVICDRTDNRNPHVQAEPGGQGRLLYQLIRPEGSPRVPVFISDFPDASGILREPAMLPIGGEWTAESSGHMAWIGTTGKIACALEWDRQENHNDPRHPKGNLAIVGPGDKEARVIGSPDHAYYHVSISRCARYFVCDEFLNFRVNAFNNGRTNGPSRIVVGSVETGRTKVLISDCQNYGCAGSSRFEPDPYFTADNGHVIYNASPWGTMQVFAAKVPAGLLESLGG
jgi:hypothetical protein